MKEWWLIFTLILLTGCGEHKPRNKVGELPEGYRGQAQFNPYLAAELYLRDGGHQARSSRLWGNFSSETGLVFMPSSFLVSRNLSETVLGWVAEGGTLILTLDGGESNRNDFTTPSSGQGLPNLNEFRGLAHLLEQLDLQVTDDDSIENFEKNLIKKRSAHVDGLARTFNQVTVRSWIDDREFELELEGSLFVSGKSAYFHQADNENRGQVAEISYGSGHFRIFSHARPFRNPFLTRADHADYLDELAAECGDREIVFIYGVGNSFFGMLWQRGKRVVIAAGILLLAWLWLRIPRFGPLLIAKKQPTNGFGGELTATARFLWHGGQIEHLLTPLRSRVSDEFHGDLRAMAEKSGLPEEEISNALSNSPPRDLRSLLRTTKTLQTLIRK